MDARGATRPTRTVPQETPSKIALIAAVLAVSSVLIALVVPRAPTSLVAEASKGGTQTIGVNCTHYEGAEVTLAVPGRGTIIVSATVGIGIGHSFGVRDEARVFLASTATECIVTNHIAFVSVPPTLPSDANHYQTIGLLRPFTVPRSGSYTFYVNGIMQSGADVVDRFDSASLVATFYQG